jgi:hypothetical protein
VCDQGKRNYIQRNFQGKTHNVFFKDIYCGGEHAKTDDDLNPVLLSKSELSWLLGDINNVSKSFEYKIKSRIRRKIQTLTELELPLLIRNNFIVNDSGYWNVIDDDRLGRDLEPGSLSSLSTNSALVRQRSPGPFLIAIPF